MRFKGLLAVILTSSMLVAGCSDKDSSYEPDAKNPTISISSFDDFTFLMFTENGNSVIRDVDGNEYSVGSDGYYYDNDGNRITEYGAGDSATAELGRSTGAISKDEKNSSSSSSNESNSSKDNTSKDTNNSTDKTDDKEEEIGDEANGEIVIEDWQGYKNQIMADAGIYEEDEASWHNHQDDMEAYSTVNGDTKLVSNTEYQTNIEFGDSIPATVNIDTIQNAGKGKVSGSITLDSEAYYDYLKSEIGDTQLNEEGEEVPADYSDLLLGEKCTVYMYATDGFNNVVSESVTIVFGEEYTGTFSVSCDIPEDFNTYLVINGTNYNI